MRYIKRIYISISKQTRILSEESRKEDRYLKVSRKLNVIFSWSRKYFTESQIRRPLYARFKLVFVDAERFMLSRSVNTEYKDFIYNSSVLSLVQNDI